MTTTNDKDRKKLSLSGRSRLSLNRPSETSQVRQSFSHGRSKTVQVERRRKRAAPAAVSPGTETAAAGDSPPGTLTAEERANRTRALRLGLRHQDGAVSPAVIQIQPTEPQPAEPAVEEVVEVDRRQAELDEARRIAEEEQARAAGEAARRAEEEAARQAKAAGERAASRLAQQPPGQDTPAPAAPPPGRAGGEEAATPSRTPRKRDARRPAAPGSRRGEPRRRTGKMTISQALDDTGSERVRSLASVRRARERERARQRVNGSEAAKQVRDVVVPERITVQELSNRMAERTVDVIKSLMKMGIMATINHPIDADTAELVAVEFGHRVKRVSEADVEIGLHGEDDPPESLRPRAPVVTIMGHVDHGKTSLLDALRQTDVAAGEAGGITQHIGAYQVTLASGQSITFLDTPGHEAFTEMRARGANVTDIVVLVVAADDGIMEQTVEAIRHAKAAGTPMIVAVNKMDRPDANPQRVRDGLLQHEVVTEEVGGDVLAVNVSALTGQGLDRLEEAILLQAELLELRANPDRRAEGTVVEAQVARGRGNVATVLIRHGTLQVGDIFVAGAEWGRVRAMIDDRGKPLSQATPSMPVEVQGLNGTPVAGDDFAVVENEGRAREIAEYRRRVIRDREAAAGQRGTVEQMLSAIAAGRAEELPMVIKTDVHGSLEAVRASVEKFSNDQVAVRVLHGAVGGINESDITLAKASKAMVVGFNVRANPQARDLARQEGVEIRYYSIIYDLIDDVRAALDGMLSPDLKEEILGNAEIREVFNITKVGRVAGCMVTEGQIRRGAKVRLLRDNVVVHQGALATLKRFKDEVREVREGYECGASFENYNDIQIGDLIECYEIREVARSLESVQQMQRARAAF